MTAAPLPDWAQLIADFRETFGPGVSVNNLRLASVPGWQLGMSFEEHVRREDASTAAQDDGLAAFGTSRRTHGGVSRKTRWRARGSALENQGSRRK